MQKRATKLKNKRRVRRKRHIRKTVGGAAECPRLSVYRSLTHIYAQLIDDEAGRTLVSASTRAKDMRDGLKATGNCDSAKTVGLKLAEKAKQAGISRAVFDRNGFRFHGRVKSLAEGAREGGLEL